MVAFFRFVGRNLSYSYCLAVSVVLFLFLAIDLVVLTATSSLWDVRGWKSRKIVCDLARSPKENSYGVP